MNEQQFGHKIKQCLNKDLAWNAKVLVRLKSARESALTNQCVTRPIHLLTLPSKATIMMLPSKALDSRLLLSGLILTLGLLATSYWYQKQQAEETVEIDSAVLTGDLPIDAYLDKGFNAWLKRSSD